MTAQAGLHDDPDTRDAERAISALASRAAFDGWACDEKEAAAEAGVSVLAFRRLAGKTPEQRLRAYFALLTARMRRAAVEYPAFPEMRIREKIAFLIFARLRACEADEHGKEALRRAVAYLTHPLRAGFALQSKFVAADAVWRAAGDTSTDLNYYSKRVLAGGVYASSLYYFLEDASPEYKDTQAFINRRIDNVMQIEKAKSKCKTLFRMP